MGGAIGVAMDLAGGKTADDQQATNTESLIARFGEALGEKLGMKFDGAGQSVVSQFEIGCSPAFGASESTEGVDISKAVNARRAARLQLTVR